MPPTVQKQMFHVKHLFGLKVPSREKRLRSPIAPPIMRPIAWSKTACLARSDDALPAAMRTRRQGGRHARDIQRSPPRGDTPEPACGGVRPHEGVRSAPAHHRRGDQPRGHREGDVLQLLPLQRGVRLPDRGQRAHARRDGARRAGRPSRREDRPRGFRELAFAHVARRCRAVPRCRRRRLALPEREMAPRALLQPRCRPRGIRMDSLEA